MKRLAVPVSFKTLLIVLLLLPSLTPMQGQKLLNRVLSRSKDKIERKVEDMIVEKVSEAVAQKVYRSMSDAFDQMLLDAMKEDSLYRANYGDSVHIKYGQLSKDWMERLNQAAEVPEAYSFDRKIHVETTDGKEKDEMIMYLSDAQAVFAIEQTERDEKRTILIDGEKDVTVMYSEDKKGKKTAQAIPNLLGMGASIASSVPVSDTIETWNFEKTGKSKKIAGYKGEEYKGSNDEYETLFYITTELGMDWRKSFATLVGKFTTVDYEQHEDLMSGFMLESHTVNLKKPKDKSSWVTKKIEDKPFEIVNADYEFGGIQQ